MLIEGAIAVKAALENHKRQVSVVYLPKGKYSKDIAYIKHLALAESVEIRTLNMAELALNAQGKSHGGILAEVSMRLEDKLSEGDIFYLDGLNDPYNLAYCLRTLYAFGFKNVILPVYNYENMQAQLLKSSAGAYDRLNIAYYSEELVKNYKAAGYHFYGLYRGEGSRDIFDEKFKEKAFFILGGEKRGIKAEILNNCDSFLHISYGSDFRNALNAAAALDVSATLLYRQRRKR